MSLAIFDLDNTLIGGDSDHAWGEFLIEEGIVDSSSHRKRNDQFYRDYQNGTLDINAYLEFALKPLAEFTMAQLETLHKRFFERKIAPMWLPKAEALVTEHRHKGDRILVITATNRFITEPIVKAFGIDDLLASDAEIIAERYTGRPIGVPCFQEGKVIRLKTWLKENQESLEASWFYSDSANDIPLLEFVTIPVAVDPDNTLRNHAEARQWPIISLR